MDHSKCHSLKASRAAAKPTALHGLMLPLHYILACEYRGYVSHHACMQTFAEGVAAVAT